MKFLSPLLVSALFVSCAQMKGKDASLPTTLEEAVNSEFRTEEYQKRDQYRHPLETLKFFGLKPRMTVVEISPGGGWYTEILAPYLVREGKYIMASPPVTANSPAYAKANEKKVKKILGRHELIKERVQQVVFDPKNKSSIVPAGTADMVLTFRNVHNWVGNGSAQAAFNSFYKALKKGGILGVVEHRAPAGKKVDPKSGYMTEAQVMALAKKAGFKLAARSEVNANPKDTANHPSGVWTLPPSLRLGDKDRAKYEAIGESDRMTLKFIKAK